MESSAKFGREISPVIRVDDFLNQNYEVADFIPELPYNCEQSALRPYMKKYQNLETNVHIKKSQNKTYTAVRELNEVPTKPENVSPLFITFFV